MKVEGVGGNYVLNQGKREEKQYLEKVNEENAAEAKERTEEDKKKFKELQEQMDAVNEDSRAYEAAKNINGAQEASLESAASLAEAGIGSVAPLLHELTEIGVNLDLSA